MSHQVYSDYYGRKINFFSRDKRRSNEIHNHKFYFESYIFPTLEFPDEVYFDQYEYVNKYIKYYQDFFVVVEVCLLEYSKTSGVQNRIRDWFLINTQGAELFLNPEKVIQPLVRGCTQIYKYLPPEGLPD